MLQELFGIFTAVEEHKKNSAIFGVRGDLTVSLIDQRNIEGKMIRFPCKEVT